MVSGVTVPPLQRVTALPVGSPLHSSQLAFPPSTMAISSLLPTPQSSDCRSSFTLALAQAPSPFPQEMSVSTFIRKTEAFRCESLRLPQPNPCCPLHSFSPLTMEMVAKWPPKASPPTGLPHPISPVGLTPINVLRPESPFSPSLLGRLVIIFKCSYLFRLKKKKEENALHSIPFLNQIFQKSCLHSHLPTTLSLSTHFNQTFNPTFPEAALVQSPSDGCITKSRGFMSWPPGSNGGYPSLPRCPGFLLPLAAPSVSLEARVTRCLGLPRTNGWLVILFGVLTSLPILSAPSLVFTTFLPTLPSCSERCLPLL